MAFINLNPPFTDELCTKCTTEEFGVFIASDPYHECYMSENTWLPLEINYLWNLNFPQLHLFPRLVATHTRWAEWNLTSPP